MPEAWNRFWFQPIPVSTLALFRIVYGLVVAAWAATLSPDTPALLGPAGVIPEPPDTRLTRISLLSIYESELAAELLVGGLVVVGLLLAAGAFTRPVSILSFIFLLSVARRDPYIANSGDSLLRHFGFFLMFAPAGKALSWDRWRAHREDFWSIPTHAPWAQRLLQLQLCFVYFFATFSKARSEEWAEGTALEDVWRVGDLVRFDLPLFVYDSVLAINLASYGTMLVELSLALFIWNRALRPYVITAGLFLHLGIEATMTVGFFGIVTCMGYLLFLPEERANQVIDRIRAWRERRAAPAFVTAGARAPITGDSRSEPTRRTTSRTPGRNDSRLMESWRNGCPAAYRSSAL